jgi:hypothetical protein
MLRPHATGSNTQSISTTTPTIPKRSVPILIPVLPERERKMGTAVDDRLPTTTTPNTGGSDTNQKESPGCGFQFQLQFELELESCVNTDQRPPPAPPPQSSVSLLVDDRLPTTTTPNTGGSDTNQKESPGCEFQFQLQFEFELDSCVGTDQRLPPAPLPQSSLSVLIPGDTLLAADGAVLHDDLWDMVESHPYKVRGEMLLFALRQQWVGVLEAAVRKVSFRMWAGGRKSGYRETVQYLLRNGRLHSWQFLERMGMLMVNRSAKLAVAASFWPHRHLYLCMWYYLLHRGYIEGPPLYEALSRTNFFLPHIQTLLSAPNVRVLQQSGVRVHPRAVSPAVVKTLIGHKMLAALEFLFGYCYWPWPFGFNFLPAVPLGTVGLTTTTTTTTTTATTEEEEAVGPSRLLQLYSFVVRHMRATNHHQVFTTCATQELRRIGRDRGVLYVGFRQLCCMETM